MDKVKIAFEKNCEKNCDERCLSCASEVLHRTNIYPHVFAPAIRDPLQNGWSKHRNILLAGRGGIFLLSSLAKGFPQTLSNPSPTKFAKNGIGKGEVIFLNDFSWKPEQIQWHDSLFLFEGQVVHLPAHMNQYSQDVYVISDLPIFVGSISLTKGKIRWYLFGGKHIDFTEN